MAGYDSQEKRITILLVEDSETAVLMIRQALAESVSAIRLDVVMTLGGAWEWLSQNTPDLAIVDLMLPDGKGTELIHPDKELTAFPILVLTGDGNEVEAVEAIKAGALEYLVKTPEVMDSLPRVVERCMREWGHIRRHRVAEAALRESEERFRSIFYTAAAGMAAISPARRITHVNAAFCRYTGYTDDELLQFNIDELIHEEDRASILAIYDDLFALKVMSVDCERRYLRKGGGDFWGHVSLSPVLTAERSVAYCIALVQDITARREMEKKLLLSNRELDAFVHNVSHDLRVLLTPIMGYVQILEEQYGDRFDQPALEMLHEVMRQSERMHDMLEDLLKLATVGGLESPGDPVCCNTVLGDVLRGFSTELARAGITVTAENLPEVRIPKTLCEQLFANLIGNALHYAGRGPIEVSGERSGETVRLSVRDHGPGVADEEKDRIFELFYRGVVGRRSSGTGIGLATVQKIARRYGGSAWVSDAPGGGSIFTVELVDDTGT